MKKNNINLINEIIKRTGLSQADLARKINIERQNLNRLVMRDSPPTTHRIIGELCAAHQEAGGTAEEWRNLCLALRQPRTP